MKNLIVLLASFLILQAVVFSQSCLPEGILFTTQEQIDDFQSNYPGCTEIEGDVQIGDGSNYYSINNLNGLSMLTSVGGHLYIWYNQSLFNLTGLNNLTYVGGDFQVIVNAYLNSLTGLEGLTYIGGNLEFEYEDALTSLDGLNNLVTIGGRLSFSYMESLENFNGLDHFTDIGGSLNVYMNSALTSFEGLEGLTTIPGVLNVEYNDVLTSLSGLENITSIGIFLRIYTNVALASLEGLTNLNSVAGNFIIEDNNALQNLAGLEDLSSIGYDLVINDNASLGSLAGLLGLTTVGGNLEIAGNESLTNLSGLDNIGPGSISNLTIYYNDVLSTCDVESICNYLASPNGIVMITNNAPGCGSVVDIGSACGNPLPCLPYGNYYLCTQTDIDNFQDIFPGCNDLNGDMRISGDSIINLDGLNALESIGGALVIRSNYILTSTSGLDNITSIGGPLEISFNDVLDDLSGLDNIAPGSISELIIILNPLLSNCDIQSICSYVGSSNGTIEIYANATGCNSPQEVVTACGFELPEGATFNTQTEIDSFQVNYPNCTGIIGPVTVGDFGSTITNLDGLNNLTFIGGEFEISHNTGLADLSGLEGITSLGSGLNIIDNDSLENLSGLNSLSSIGFSLEISGNDDLTSLTGLENLDGYTIKALYIMENSSLTTCGLQCVCEFFFNPEHGNYEIIANNTGCNDPEEVEFACGVGIEESSVGSLQSAVIIMPNPAYTTITVELPGTSSKFLISIFDYQGREMMRQQASGSRTELDISTMPEGVYFVRIVDEGSVLVGKFVKM